MRTIGPPLARGAATWLFGIRCGVHDSERRAAAARPDDTGARAPRRRPRKRRRRARPRRCRRPRRAPPPRSEPAPPRDSDVPPARPQSDASGASGVLLEQSRAQRAAGSLPAARASLERALRLDPNNPVLWLELGELELQTGNNTQAATLARKAMTLTGRDTRLATRAERLLRAAE